MSEKMLKMYVNNKVYRRVIEWGYSGNFLIIQRELEDGTIQHRPMNLNDIDYITVDVMKSGDKDG